MYPQFVDIFRKPAPFEFYTTETLWNDPHISQRMLECHLDETGDLASRNRAFITRSTAWIAEHFSIGPGKRLCDFGCGPGLYTLDFARRGACVTGVDFSERSIDYAREAARRCGLPVNYVQGNYLDFEPDEPYDLATMIMCDYCVLSPAQRHGFLSKVRRLLAPGGAFLFDAYTMKAFADRQEQTSLGRRLMDGFWSAGDYFGILNVFKYPEEKVVLDQYTIVEPERTWQVHNWLQYYSPEMLAADLEACGLRIDEIYGDVAGSSYHENSDEFAVVVKRS